MHFLKFGLKILLPLLGAVANTVQYGPELSLLLKPDRVLHQLEEPGFNSAGA